jgi:probable H4MPT-linked C1 transfer pathway protein
VTTALGWDIGGANVKAAYVSRDGPTWHVRTASRPFEIWKNKEALPEVLRAVAAELPAAAAAAVTMTAELSDAFRTKREGVGFVLDAVSDVCRGAIGVFATDGRFVDMETARARHLVVAASNWLATAMLVARHVPDCVLIDIGSTTTDLTPIRAGRVVAQGLTDPTRLLAGELVYTGALRTNVAAVVSQVPLWGGWCPVAAEFFAVSGDAHVLLGNLSQDDYASPTPDGRPPTPAFAAERLARVVCADIEMLTRDDLLAIARAIDDAQRAQVASALTRMAARLDTPVEVIVTGLGGFIGRRAAAHCGFSWRDLSDVLHVDVSVAAPAVAVAWLMVEGMTP